MHELPHIRLSTIAVSWLPEAELRPCPMANLLSALRHNQVFELHLYVDLIFSWRFLWRFTLHRRSVSSVLTWFEQYNRNRNCRNFFSRILLNFEIYEIYIYMTIYVLEVRIMSNIMLLIMTLQNKAQFGTFIPFLG